jgi:hypothetical protein
MFLHGGWFHIINNMWVLFIFGDNVEARMGSAKYLVFYLLSGTAAGLLQTFVLPDSQVPMIGASGAVAGVLGAYLVLFRARASPAWCPSSLSLPSLRSPPSYTLSFGSSRSCIRAGFPFKESEEAASPGGRTSAGSCWIVHVVLLCEAEKDDYRNY